MRAEPTDRCPATLCGSGDEEHGPGEDQTEGEQVVAGDRGKSQIQKRPVVGCRSRGRGEIDGVDPVAGWRSAVQRRDERPGRQRSGSVPELRIEANHWRGSEAVAQHGGELLDEPRVAIRVVEHEDPIWREVLADRREGLGGEQERLEAEVGRRAHQRE